MIHQVLPTDSSLGVSKKIRLRNLHGSLRLGAGHLSLPLCEVGRQTLKHSEVFKDVPAAAGSTQQEKDPKRQQISKRWRMNPEACPFPTPSLFPRPRDHAASQDPSSTPRLPNPMGVSTNGASASRVAAPRSHLLHIGRRVPLDQIL